MCDCLNKSTEKVLSFVKENMKKDGKKVSEFNDKDSGYVNRVLTFGGANSGWQLVMPFEVKYTPIKTNGTPGKEVAYKTSIFPAFCPFCGKKMPKN